MTRRRVFPNSPLRRLAAAALCIGLAAPAAHAGDATPQAQPTMRLAARAVTKAEQPRPVAQTPIRPVYSASAYSCTPSGFGRVARCVQRGG